MSEFYELSTGFLEELWVELAVGGNRKWVAVHRLAHYLSQTKCRIFSSWYASTGCDTVFFLSFMEKGMKSAWKTWKCYPEASEVFLSLQNPVDGSFSDISISAIERFICLMYDKTVDNISRTRNALIHHNKRLVYQAG